MITTTPTSRFTRPISHSPGRLSRGPVAEPQRRHSTDHAAPANRPALSRSQQSRRTAAAVAMGLTMTGLCGAVINQLGGPMIDATGLMAAGGLYIAIGLAPQPE